MSETAAYLQAEAEANWIRNMTSQKFGRTPIIFLFLSGYLTFLLTGKFVDSIGCQVGYIPFDYKRMKWAGKWTGSCRLCP